MVATMPMSEPDSTSVDARAARQTARNGSRNQVRIGTAGRCPPAPPPRRAGVGRRPRCATPPSDAQHLGGEEHPRRRPLGGRPHGEGRRDHERQLDGGGVQRDGGAPVGLSPPTAMTACRVIEKVGMTNSPATTASTSSGQYPTNGAMLQQTTRHPERGQHHAAQAEPVEQPATPRARSPRWRWWRLRPGHRPRRTTAPSVVTTCTVSSTPLAKTGPRTSVPSTRIGPQRAAREGTPVGREGDGGHRDTLAARPRPRPARAPDSRGPLSRRRGRSPA